jgi:hypothetical protein
VAALLQIVASVGSTTSLLDLNDTTAQTIVVQRAGSGGGGDLSLAEVDPGDVAMPIWSPAGASTVPEATSRQITVPVHLMGSTVDVVASRAQSLIRLLGQPWVLRVRRSGSAVDGWIRCFPTIPQLETDVTGSHGGGVVRGVIVAQTEPYAYGSRVDRASVAVPIVNMTTAGAFVLDIPAPAGDAPTPLLIRCSDAALVGTAHGTMFAVRRTGIPANLTGLALSATSGTATVAGTGPTTSTLSADAALSGGTGVRFSFPASFSGYGRIAFTPALTGAEAPGLYKLLARIRRSTTEEYIFNTTLSGVYKLDTVTLAATGTNTRMIDLGIIQLPVGQPQQLAAPTAAVIGAEPPLIWFDTARTTGTAATTIDVDYFLLVPCDEDAGAVYQSAAAPAGAYLTIDGYAQDAYLTTGDPLLAASAGQSGTPRLDYVGGVPRLYPGIANRVFIVGGFSTVTIAALASAPAFQLSHWPRYTWLP